MESIAPCLSTWTPPQCLHYGFCRVASDGPGNQTSYSCQCHLGSSGLNCSSLVLTPQQQQLEYVFCGIAFATSIAIFVITVVTAVRTRQLAKKKIYAKRVAAMMCAFLACAFSGAFYACGPDGAALRGSTSLAMAAGVFAPLSFAFVDVSFMVGLSLWTELASTGKRFAILWDALIFSSAAVLVSSAVVFGVLTVYVPWALFVFCGVIIFFAVACLIATLVTGVIIIRRLSSMQAIMANDSASHRRAFVRNVSIRFIVLVSLGSILLTIVSVVGWVLVSTEGNLIFVGQAVVCVGVCCISLLSALWLMGTVRTSPTTGSMQDNSPSPRGKSSPSQTSSSGDVAAKEKTDNTAAWTMPSTSSIDAQWNDSAKAVSIA